MKVIAAVLLAVACAALGSFGPASAKDQQLSREECARKAQEAAGKLREIAIAIETEAAYAEAHGGAFSPQLSQQFVRWYQAEGSKAGSDLPELWRTDLTREDARRRQAAVDRFHRERTDRHKAMATTIKNEAARGCPALVPLHTGN